MRRIEPVFVALVATQAAHSLEEWRYRLYDVFPPARLLSGLVAEDRERGFVAINLALVAFGVWCAAVPVHRRWPSAATFVWSGRDRAGERRRPPALVVHAGRLHARRRHRADPARPGARCSLGVSAGEARYSTPTTNVEAAIRHRHERSAECAKRCQRPVGHRRGQEERRIPMSRGAYLPAQAHESRRRSLAVRRSALSRYATTAPDSRAVLCGREHGIGVEHVASHVSRTLDRSDRGRVARTDRARGARAHAQPIPANGAATCSTVRSARPA
jgi:hypothetical protein